jgi:hypothetical protein
MTDNFDLKEKLLKLRNKLIVLGLVEDAQLVERAAREFELVRVERDKLKADRKQSI